MSVSSSSSEDDFEKLKEAVDENFLTESLYSKDKLKNNSNSQPHQPPSLRGQNHKVTSINPFSIRVTPEFQSYVSKHLSRLLDELIDDTEIIPKRKKVKDRCKKSGVKLLYSSKDYLTSSSDIKVQDCPKMLVKKKNVNVNIYTERAKEVAVSPEWVLSQEETRHWAPNTKGEVEVVKLGTCKKKNFHGQKRKTDTETTMDPLTKHNTSLTVLQETRFTEESGHKRESKKQQKNESTGRGKRKRENIEIAWSKRWPNQKKVNFILYNIIKKT